MKMYAVIAKGEAGVLFADKADAEYAATGASDEGHTPTLGDAFREIYTPDNDFMQYEVVEIDTTLRPRLEALVSELDPPSKTGEIVVMTAERVERHLIARKIREILEGEDETA